MIRDKGLSFRASGGEVMRNRGGFSSYPNPHCIVGTLQS